MDSRMAFVVFSDDWGRHPSSCQHLFKRIARRHLVLWVNTIGLRAPRANPFTVLRGLEKLHEWTCLMRPVNTNMWVLAPIMLPVCSDGVLGKLNSALAAATIASAMRRIGVSQPVFVTSVPTARDFLGRLDESLVLYYVTDDYSTWPGSQAERIRRLDRELTERADLIFASGLSLAASHASRTAQTVLLPHAVDFEHFARPAPPPMDLLSLPRPRVCYFGLVWEKIELDGLAYLAERLPQVHLVLIGPVKTAIGDLACKRNVHLLGPRPYEQLPAYLHAMDVMLLPYVLDRNIAPLKLRECMAVGKAIVARDVPDLRVFADLIRLYNGWEDMAQGVVEALANGDPSLPTRMQDRVREDTWERRAETVLAKLELLLAAPRSFRKQGVRQGPHQGA